MEKIPISKVVEFRGHNEGPRITLINNLKKPKKPKKENSSDGGDYWTTSVSAISKTYKEEDLNIIKDKIYEVGQKRENAPAKISKDMFQRNVEILHTFEQFDFKPFKPNFELKYISKPRNKSIFKINDVPIQVLPQHVFTYIDKDLQKIGAIWFVSKLKGYKKEEVGIFTDALYRYLDLNYSKDFSISF